MITFGIILLIVGAIIYLLRPQLAEQDVYEGEHKVRSKAPPVLLMFSRPIASVMMFFGLVLSLLPLLILLGRTRLPVFPGTSDWDRKCCFVARN